MLLYLSGNEITSYSEMYTNKEAQLQIQYGGAVLYDGEFNFSMGENRDGFIKKFYYDAEEKKIRIEYESAPQTDEIIVDSSVAKLDYLIMMQEGENV